MQRWLIIPLLALVLSGTAMAASPTYALAVDGLACPFCAYGLEKKLNAIDDIANIETDVKSGQVLVTAAEGKTLDEKTVRAAVEDAGFKLRSMTETGDRE